MRPPSPPPLFPATTLPPSLLTFAETERSDDVIDKGPYRNSQKSEPQYVYHIKSL